MLDIPKSTKPFSEKLEEACQILDVRVDVSRPFQEFERAGGSKRTKYTTDETWTLRWLLKCFRQAGEDPGDNPLVEPRAWLLLGEVVRCIPLSTSAWLLTEFRFLELVEIALKSIQSYTVHHESHEASASLHSRAESSPVTIEGDGAQPKAKARRPSNDGNHSVAQPSSKKRKRGEASPPVNNVQLLDHSSIPSLYMSICSAVAAVQSLTVEFPDQHRGYAVEHAKKALRSSPERAAAILGASCSALEGLLRNPGEEMGFNGGYIYESCISPMIRIWESKSTIRADDCQPAFGNAALLPILELLCAHNDTRLYYKSKDDAVKALETLIIEHNILPAREAFFQNHSSTHKSAVTSENHFKSTESFSSLEQYRFRDCRESQHSSTMPFALLLRIAFECTPRDTAIQKANENPWLRYLFAQLVQRMSASINGSNLSDPKEQYSMAQKIMLDIILDYKVQLQVSELGDIISDLTGLFDADIHVTVDWRMTSLCLKLNPDIFIVKQDNSDQERPTANKYLTALIEKITNTNFSPRGQDYGLSEILLPLMNAFADARDLTSFIHHWIEQLQIHPPKNRHYPKPKRKAFFGRSIWQSHQLQKAVACRAKKLLTERQMKKILVKMDEDLWTTAKGPKGNYQSYSQSFAASVIIECLLGSCESETMLKSLTAAALQISVSVLKIIGTSLDWTETNRWRFWLIASDINILWPLLNLNPGTQVLANVALKVALELFQGFEKRITVTKQDYTEEICAFRFLLSMPSMGLPADSQLFHRSKTTAVEVFRNILMNNHDLCERIRLDSEGIRKQKDKVPQWEGFVFKVSLSELPFFCFSQVLADLTSLRYTRSQRK